MANQFEYRDFVTQFSSDAEKVRQAMGGDPFYPVVKGTTDQFIELRGGERLLNFAGCDYLGFSAEPQLVEHATQAIRKHGLNITGAQCFSGFSEYHEELENKLAKLYRKEAACLLSSGTLANISVLSSLAEPGDYIFNDAFNHSSLVAGTQMSGATYRVFPHNNTERLEREIAKLPAKAKKIITVDGIYSADGDHAPIRKLADIADKYNAALVVDEAHSIGVVGDNLMGAADDAGELDRVTVVTGTMSKAMGSIGGFAAGPRELIDFMKHMSGFATGSRGAPYGLAAASCAALDLLPTLGNERSEIALRNARNLAEAFKNAGFDVRHGHSAIVSVICGDMPQTVGVAFGVRERGVLASTMVYPSVPKRHGRLRFCVTAHHTDADIDATVKTLVEQSNHAGLPPIAS